MPEPKTYQLISDDDQAVNDLLAQLDDDEPGPEAA